MHTSFIHSEIFLSAFRVQTLLSPSYTVMGRTSKVYILVCIGGTVGQPVFTHENSSSDPHYEKVIIKNKAGCCVRLCLSNYFKMGGQVSLSEEITCRLTPE